MQLFFNPEKSIQEVAKWTKVDNPLTRLRAYMELKGWWDETQEQAHRSWARSEILRSFRDAEAMKKPALKELFADVYDVKTPNLIEQEKELHRMLKEYPDEYAGALGQHAA
jgi:2-oxoisovalerate dehydrogenase E1 component alpha subunit